MQIIRTFKTPLALFALFAAALALSPIPVKAAAPFDNLVAKAAVLVESDSGAVLFEHNKDMHHPADGLTRVMTMILALTAVGNGDANLGEFIVMTDSALSGLPSTGMANRIRSGEEMTLIDLMYCAFIGGSTEACNLIAEHIAGSVDAFVVMMNERAELIGCENTNFTNPHGVHNDNQYTTAYDMFLIYREALTFPVFEDISGTFRYTIEPTNKTDSRRLTGSNSLLNTAGKYYFRSCTSGLASITYEGGHSFVGAAESEGLAQIVVVLGSDVVMLPDESAEMRNLTEAARLFQWGFAEFSWRTILSTGMIVAKAAVLHGDGADYVNLCPESDIRLLIDNDVPDSDFINNVIIYADRDREPLIAPVEAGDVLGEVTVTRRDPKTGKLIVYDTLRLVANTDVKLNRLQFVKMQLDDALSSRTARLIVWILTVLVIGYVGLVIRYNVMRSKRAKKIREAKIKLIEERQHESDWDGWD